MRSQRPGRRALLAAQVSAASRVVVDPPLLDAMGLSTALVLVSVAA